MPVLLALSQDRVANIRMNVAKSIQTLWPVVAAQAQANQDIIVSNLKVNRIYSRYNSCSFRIL